MVRMYRAGDLDQVYAIYCHYVLHSNAIFDRVPQSKESFGALLDHLLEQMPVLVSEVDGQIIGYGYLHPAFVKEAYEHDYELTIYFRPGPHYGEPKEMLDLLVEAARQMQSVWIISCITSDNRPSIAFHQRNGFQFYGELPEAGLKDGKWHGVCWFALQVQDPDQVQAPVPFCRTDLGRRLTVPVKGVLFDMDGLMFDTESLFLRVFPAIMREHGLALGKADLVQVIGCDAAIFQKLEADVPGICDVYRRTYAVDRMQYFLKVFPEKGDADKKGLCELTAWLEQEGIPYGICSSSSRRDILSCLDRAGRKLCPAVILSGKEGFVSKPDPDIFLAGARALGLEPESVLVLEDSKYGLQAARRGGFRSVWIPDRVPADEELLENVQVQADSLLDVIGYIRKENGYGG